MIDLHLHTTASDGIISPTQLIHAAKKANLKIISITDHETIDGISEATAAGQKLGIEVIPGVELLTCYKDMEIHLLGYYIDIHNKQLTQKLQQWREERNNIAKEILQKLQSFGFDITWEYVKSIANTKGCVSKGHIIRSIYAAGYFKCRKDSLSMIQKYLGSEGLAYIQYKNNPFEEAVKTILEAGGIPVIAHPGLVGDDSLISELISLYPVGLEVYYYYLSNLQNQWIDKYLKMAQVNKLLITGGSDFHGNSNIVPLGKLSIPEEVVDNLRVYCQKIKKNKKTPIFMSN